MPRNVTWGYQNTQWTLPLPPKCPLCWEIVAITVCAFFHKVSDRVEALFLCPNSDCQRLFLCIYCEEGSPDLRLKTVYPVVVGIAEIKGVVTSLSPDFAKFYCEAKQAKQLGLSNVCGPGYRKAFEFLIKDYAKSLVTSDDARNAIEKSFAGKVVDEFIPDARIQAVAKRALWLGNDETHYLRRWTEHDVEDLIALIQLTMHWIEIEVLSKKYMTELPESSKH